MHTTSSAPGARPRRAKALEQIHDAILTDLTDGLIVRVVHQLDSRFDQESLPVETRVLLGEDVGELRSDQLVSRTLGKHAENLGLVERLRDGLDHFTVVHYCSSLSMV